MNQGDFFAYACLFIVACGLLVAVAVWLPRIFRFMLAVAHDEREDEAKTRYEAGGKP